MPIHQQWRLTSPLASTRLVNKLLLHVCCVDSFFLKLLAIRNKPENFFFFFLNKGRPLQAIKNCKRNKKKNVIKWKKKEEERLPAGNKRRVKTISYTSISSFSQAGLSTLVAAAATAVPTSFVCAYIGWNFVFFLYLYKDGRPFPLLFKKEKEETRWFLSYFTHIHTQVDHRVPSTCSLIVSFSLFPILYGWAKRIRALTEVVE